jgi:hypothetical protein
VRKFGDGNFVLANANGFDDDVGVGQCLQNFDYFGGFLGKATEFASSCHGTNEYIWVARVGAHTDSIPQECATGYWARGVNCNDGYALTPSA